jgi:hypothetical protein
LSDIFISYARDDLSKVSALASALDEKGWSFGGIKTSGKPFDRVIEYELAHAKCIALSGRSASVNSDWVRAEAEDVGKTSEYDIPYYKTEWSGKVFQKGDRVRNVVWDGKAKGNEPYQ